MQRVAALVVGVLVASVVLCSAEAPARRLFNVQPASLPRVAAGRAPVSFAPVSVAPVSVAPVTRQM